MTKKSNLNVTHHSYLPAASELMEELPCNRTQALFVENAKKEILKSLQPSDNRLLLIAGPCSIHDIKAAKEYAMKLRDLAKQVEDTFYVVMRVYFEKPRTSLGWKGILYDPHLDNSNAMHTGMRLTRKLLLELADLEIPAAAELLDPITAIYFGDLISWGCIGARTSESQIHRQMASSLPMPVAFKNSTSGNIDIAIQGILTAAQPHSYPGINEAGRLSLIHSAGNPHGHIVLRGGEHSPNYDPESISNALNALQRAGVEPAVVIDCSHDNSRRKYEQQIAVFQSVIHQILEGEKGIRGLILESNLFQGNQPFTGDPSQLKYAVSLTDPCLNWDTTAQLTLWGHEMLNKHKKSTAKTYALE